MTANSVAGDVRCKSPVQGRVFWVPRDRSQRQPAIQVQVVESHAAHQTASTNFRQSVANNLNNVLTANLLLRNHALRFGGGRCATPVRAMAMACARRVPHQLLTVAPLSGESACCFVRDWMGGRTALHRPPTRLLYVTDELFGQLRHPTTDGKKAAGVERPKLRAGDGISSLEHAMASARKKADYA